MIVKEMKKIRDLKTGDILKRKLTDEYYPIDSFYYDGKSNDLDKFMYFRYFGGIQLNHLKNFFYTKYNEFEVYESI